MGDKSAVSGENYHRTQYQNPAKWIVLFLLVVRVVFEYIDLNFQPGSPPSRIYEAPTPGSGWANTPGGNYSEAGTPRDSSHAYGNKMISFLANYVGPLSDMLTIFFPHFVQQMPQALICHLLLVDNR